MIDPLLQHLAGRDSSTNTRITLVMDGKYYSGTIVSAQEYMNDQFRQPLLQQARDEDRDLSSEIHRLQGSIDKGRRAFLHLQDFRSLLGQRRVKFEGAMTRIPLERIDAFFMGGLRKRARPDES